MWSPADLVILVPMLGRPHRVEPLLDSIHEATPTAAVLFLVTPEDVDVHDAVDRAGKPRLSVPWRQVGDFARKTNEGIQATSEPLIFTGADDLKFHPGWFERAVTHLEENVGVVGTRDLCNRRTKWDHSTHSLVTREYVQRFGTIDEPGKLFHEGYVHEFVDDEMVQTAIHRKAYRHSDAVVEHLHPMAQKAPVDQMYAAQGERMAASRELFNERRRLWTR